MHHTRRACRLGIGLVVVMVGLVTSAATASANAGAMETRTLFLTERFQATSMRPALAGPVQPEHLMTLRGEREGFQLALRNAAPHELALAARVVPGTGLAQAQTAARIGWELLRVGTVHVPRGSTGMGTSGGAYADPLPPFGEGPAGLLQVAPGTWGGVVLLANVRVDADPGIYPGALELFDPATGIVHASRPFSITVRNGTVLSAGATGSFKTVLDVESPVYWLQHEAMRNGPSMGYPTAPDRLKQLAGLHAFLDSRGVTPLNTPFASPGGDGTYGCSYDSPGETPAFSFRSQLESRYFGRLRELDPTRAQMATRMVPTESAGCDPDRGIGAFHATTDSPGTPTVKQDDTLAPGAGAFFANVAAAWTANGWFTASTYALNPFDEPGDATAAMRSTMRTQVPAANVALHRAFGPRAKVVLASWPRDERRQRICRARVGCTTASRDEYGNRHMWDGRGQDDVDVWMPQFGRLFGRTNTPTLRRYGFSRHREYADRLARIRAAVPGRETWSYNFFTATPSMPQLTIDAPGTDARLQYWLLAREGHTGLFVSNTMLGWSAVPKLLPNGLRFKGNPYDEATYFEHRRWGRAAGWGTFIYPGYRPQLGLASEAARNTEQAFPVTSLRFEGMRDGQEDANLVGMYRKRFGSAALAREMRFIFPGGYRNMPASHGGVVFPVYDNRNLAQRLEARRRSMITRLAPAR